MGKFKRKALHLLVATDVAARGIDVNGLSHVINYNLPQEIELYTHRSGRTGRADRKGISIAIINQREKGKLRRIEQVIKKEFTRLPIPSAREICEKQLLHLINGINAVEVRKDLYSFQQLINEQWSEIPKEELIEKMLSYEFNRFFDYYRKAKDINITEKPEGKKSSIRKDEDTGKDRGRDRRESRKQKEKNFELGKCEDGFSWVRVNLGYKHKVTPRLIIDIMKECGANKKDVGRIEITNECLFAAVKSNIAGYVASEIDGATYRRHKLRADIWK